MPTPANELVTAALLRGWPLPQPGATKHSRGGVLVAGGSPSTPGAVLLAGLASLRVGAGILALAVAQPVAAAAAVAVPEASVLALPDRHEDFESLASRVRSVDSVLIGPGLDDASSAEQLLRQILRCVGDATALVLDAFALGVLAQLDVTEQLAGRTVLTPNQDEAARLLDLDDRAELDDQDGPEVAARIAARYGSVVTVGGHVAHPDGQTWTVPTGHAGLGTSGSGDVLAGAAAGLLARGAEPAQAAAWATFLHATAGDRLAARVGRLGFLAREVVDELPLVLVQTEA
jgi:ADP-dependent NAD(P)H-hydrate dehydratase